MLLQKFFGGKVDQKAMSGVWVSSPTFSSVGGVPSGIKQSRVSSMR